MEQEESKGTERGGEGDVVAKLYRRSFRCVISESITRISPLCEPITHSAVSYVTFSKQPPFNSSIISYNFIPESGVMRGATPFDALTSSTPLRRHNNDSD